MRIRKTFQGEIPENKIVNMRSNSQTDAYACDYANSLAYPVGSVYISTDSTSPASLFGGTWTQIKDKFLYATTTSNTTGGSNTNSHSHGLGNGYARFLYQWIENENRFVLQVKNTEWWSSTRVSNSSGPRYEEWAWGFTQGTALGGSTDGPSDTNNMPAYYTVYAWRRIS